MLKFEVILLIALTVLCSCTAEEKAGMEELAADHQLSDTATNLSHVGYPLEIYLPKSLLSTEDLNIEYNTGFGQIECELGERFDISIAEDDLSIEQIKNDLNQDQLFTYKFFECGQDQLYYQALLPTGEAYFYHYARSVEINGLRYLIRTDPLGEFRKEDIKLIIESTKTLRGIHDNFQS